MKQRILILFLLFSVNTFAIDSWIRVNQMGYLPNSEKRAVFLSFIPIETKIFTIHHLLTDEIVYQSNQIEYKGKFFTFQSSAILDFSDFNLVGTYYLKFGNSISPKINISNDVYKESADFILNYMRQQRCGYNPMLDMQCHQHDGYEVYGENPSEHKMVDVIGGWHDASDYLQYGTTSSNAVFQLLFAYQMNPEVYADKFDANGNPNPNGIPDILDEAKWGLDWLLKMYPKNGTLYHQIADDRDHASFRLPSEDYVDYGWGEGKGRPVYKATGKPQGLFQNKNRTNGIASIAGKYASAFSLGSVLLQKYYPEYAELLEEKAKSAYQYGVANPGVCQTAPGKSPYFYEEDNWADDMELAAVQLYQLTKEKKYLKAAIQFGRMEPVTPWMVSDTARHYQWYPFLNIGHFEISKINRQNKNDEFLNFMKIGLESLYQKTLNSPFQVVVPFIWCSNNLVTAAASFARLYREISADTKYTTMENALIDWLFGCNPWGTSMMVGLPKNGDYPSDPHSALWLNHRFQTWGGLVDGPVKSAIFNNLLGVHLTKEDTYALFQTEMAVYHDDYADYSTNEPTMDGTASLSYILSSKEKDGLSQKKEGKNSYSHGGIIRTDKEKKQISLIFSGHEFADGYDEIISTLQKHKIKASFFFTGYFYRNPKFSSLITNLKESGHYLGAHSDHHLLYNSWEKRDSTLIDKEVFTSDLRNNYKEMARFGIKATDSPFYLPPFEWYNDTISTWAKELGIQIINFTAGTYSNSDYTTPEMKNYLSSKEIYKKIMNVERQNGLNGNIMLFHIGTSEKRSDKFYPYLDNLFTELVKKGYSFVSLEKAIY